MITSVSSWFANLFALFFQMMGRRLLVFGGWRGSLIQQRCRDVRDFQRCWRRRRVLPGTRLSRVRSAHWPGSRHTANLRSATTTATTTSSNFPSAAAAAASADAQPRNSSPPLPPSIAASQPKVKQIFYSLTDRLCSIEVFFFQKSLNFYLKIFDLFYKVSKIFTPKHARFLFSLKNYFQ